MPHHLEHPSDLRRWVLIRRSRTDPDKLASFPCSGSADADDELVGVADSRWAVEERSRTATDEVGLDQYQVRRYDTWYRPIARAALARSFLAVIAAGAPGAQAAGIPLTLAGTRVSWRV